MNFILKRLSACLACFIFLMVYNCSRAAIVATISSTDTPKLIPDPGTTSSSISVNDSTLWSVIGIRVNLNLTSTDIGDIYCSLTYHPSVGSDQTCVLFNAISPANLGFTNMSIWLSGNATTSIQSATSISTGSEYAPGGTLTVFNGVDPNGTWTLFFEDLNTGDSTTLNSWSLEITAVPEPTLSSLSAFGILLTGWFVVASCRKRLSTV